VVLRELNLHLTKLCQSKPQITQSSFTETAENSVRSTVVKADGPSLRLGRKKKLFTEPLYLKQKLGVIKGKDLWPLLTSENHQVLVASKLTGVQCLRL
jgi:hypothetical protein